MSTSPQPGTPAVDDRTVEVAIYSHSPLFYWWPVWAVGFLMAGVSFFQGQQVAFVPPGTVAERGVKVEGHDGPRDILIVPAGRQLPSASDTDELKQPRFRMAQSSDPGIVWAMTLLLVIFVTHVKMRGVWSLVAIIFVGFATVLLAVLRLGIRSFNHFGSSTST